MCVRELSHMAMYMKVPLQICLYVFLHLYAFHQLQIDSVGTREMLMLIFTGQLFFF